MVVLLMQSIFALNEVATLFIQYCFIKDIEYFIAFRDVGTLVIGTFKQADPRTKFPQTKSPRTKSLRTNSQMIKILI